MMPLTDAYALRGVARFGLNYGPLRLWGSAAFVAGALACGMLVDIVAARHLIWVIAALGASRRHCQPRAAAARPSQGRTSGGQGRECAAARSRISRHHRRVGPDPGQPRRLLHLCLDQLAGGRAGRTDDCRAVGAGRACRDRGVRAVAALYAAAGAAGGDRRAQRGRALADYRAGAVGCGVSGSPTRTWVDLRAHPGGHHEPSGASRADPHDGARARLPRGLRRHGHHGGIDPVGHGLCGVRSAGLLRDGGDGACCRCSSCGSRDGVIWRISPTAPLPADRSGCRRSAGRRRGRGPAAAVRPDRRTGPAARAALRGPSPAKSRPCSRS